jgi:hypothetical protein
MENPKQPIHLQTSAFSAGYDLQNSPADLALQYVAALSRLVNRIKLIADHLLRTIYSHIHDQNLTFDKLDRSEAAENVSKVRATFSLTRQTSICGHGTSLVMSRWSYVFFGCFAANA